MAREIQHCVICAWRRDCKLRFSLFSKSPYSFYCPHFTRDVTIKDPDSVIRKQILKSKDSNNEIKNSQDNSIKNSKQ